MIPKTIHYCWFGRGDKPKEFKQYLAGFQKLLPDYKVKEWNEDNFDVNFSAYTREDYGMRSFAHVSDVCRIYALYTEGGIYLDTDVEVLKSFDPFLDNKSFVGSEDSKLLGTAVIGSEPAQPWLKAFLDYYKAQHFINPFGHPVRTPNTKILTEIILPKIDKSLWPAVYPVNFFCGINTDTNQPIVDEDTITIHHFAASWRKNKTLKTRIITLFKGLECRYVK